MLQFFCSILLFWIHNKYEFIPKWSSIGSITLRVTRQTGSFIERDSFSAMYLSNGDSLNPNFFNISLASKNQENGI